MTNDLICYDCAEHFAGHYDTDQYRDGDIDDDDLYQKCLDPECGNCDFVPGAPFKKWLEEQGLTDLDDAIDYLNQGWGVPYILVRQIQKLRHTNGI